MFFINRSGIRNHIQICFFMRLKEQEARVLIPIQDGVVVRDNFILTRNNEFPPLAPSMISIHER